jgi:hypothetical protein
MNWRDLVIEKFEAMSLIDIAGSKFAASGLEEDYRFEDPRVLEYLKSRLNLVRPGNYTLGSFDDFYTALRSLGS